MTTCATCSTEIPHGRRFCSRDCYHASRRTIDELGRRSCRECGVKFYDHEVVRRAGNWCAKCRAAYYRVLNANNREAQRQRNLRKFGLTVKEYDVLLERQGGVCAICNRPPGGVRLAVDHSHETGQVRGLLCFNCNVAIGKLHDDPTLLLRAADYLLNLQSTEAVHAHR